VVVGELSTASDVVVIGGGPGGYAAAIRCAQLGRSVVLVERTAIGGTCLNVGCIPSKVLLRAAELAHLPADAAGSGVRLTAEVDLAAIKANIDDVVAGLTGGVAGLLDTAGVSVVEGTGRFARPNRLVVTPSSDGSAQHIEFGQAIVATGSRPIELPGLPFSDERIIDSTGALFAIDEVPRHLVIVGGGYIGIELGTAWAKLGAGVTIVEAAPSILPALDSRLARLTARRLAELGVDVRTGTSATSLDDDGLLLVPADQADPATGNRKAGNRVAADLVVVAVGRRPNTDDLGLDVVGITPDQDGLIPVDPSRRAGPNVLAIGDVTAGPALAHKATAEAEVAARTTAGEVAAFDVAAIPAVVFADPELATVGLSTEAAARAGIDAASFVFPLRASARARTIGATVGHVELIADEEGTVIGANLAGPHVSELIGEIALAVEMAATVEEVAATIHPHPTVSEGLVEAAHGLLGRPLHVAGARTTANRGAHVK
jgi:dihydrolipoamide dehydrogenase